MALFSGVSAIMLIGGFVWGLIGICLESVAFGVPLIVGLGLGGSVSSFAVALVSAAIIVDEEFDSFLEERKCFKVQLLIANKSLTLQLKRSL